MILFNFVLKLYAYNCRRVFRIVPLTPPTPQGPGSPNGPHIYLGIPLSTGTSWPVARSYPTGRSYPSGPHLPLGPSSSQWTKPINRGHLYLWDNIYPTRPYPSFRTSDIEKTFLAELSYLTRFPILQDAPNPRDLTYIAGLHLSHRAILIPWDPTCSFRFILIPQKKRWDNEGEGKIKNGADDGGMQGWYNTIKEKWG